MAISILQTLLIKWFIAIIRMGIRKIVKCAFGMYQRRKNGKLSY